MNPLYRFYRMINVLSLDVAAGSVVNALFFGRLLDVKILPYGLAVLALTVWIIYTADHLADAKRIPGPAASERHRFHQRNFKLMLTLLLTAIVVDTILLLFIKRDVFIWGLCLTSVVAFYLLFHRKLYFLKEVLVAVLYTSGVLLPSLAVTVTDIDSYHILVFCQFFFVALINLLLFSWFDSDRDKADKLTSFVTHFGKPQTTKIITVLFVCSFITHLTSLYLHHAQLETSLLAVMTLVLLAIFCFHAFFGKKEYYRMVGDAIFFFPIVAFL